MAFSLRAWSLYMDNWNDICLLSSNCEFLILSFWNSLDKSIIHLHRLISDDFGVAEYGSIGMILLACRSF